MYENARLIYERTPQYETKLFGKKKYLGSEILVDETAQIFEEFQLNKNASYQQYSMSSHCHMNQNHGVRNSQMPYNMPPSGFCIRTREQIAFDPTRPFSYSAYKMWEKLQ